MNQKQTPVLQAVTAVVVDVVAAVDAAVDARPGLLLPREAEDGRRGASRWEVPGPSLQLAVRESMKRLGFARHVSTTMTKAKTHANYATGPNFLKGGSPPSVPTMNSEIPGELQWF